MSLNVKTFQGFLKNRLAISNREAFRRALIALPGTLAFVFVWDVVFGNVVCPLRCFPSVVTYFKSIPLMILVLALFLGSVACLNYILGDE